MIDNGINHFRAFITWEAAVVAVFSKYNQTYFETNSEMCLLNKDSQIL